MRTPEEKSAIKVIALAMAERALAEKDNGAEAVMSRLESDEVQLLLDVGQECAKALGLDAVEEPADVPWRYVQLKGLKP